MQNSALLKRGFQCIADFDVFEDKVGHGGKSTRDVVHVDLNESGGSDVRLQNLEVIKCDFFDLSLRRRV